MSVLRARFTAPGIVMDALSEDTREFGLNPQVLNDRRKEGCFPTLEDLRGAFGAEQFSKLGILDHGIEQFLPRKHICDYWHH